MNSFRTLTRCIILRKKIFSPRSKISFEHGFRQMSQFRKHWGENKESLWSENDRNSDYNYKYNSDPDGFLRKKVQSKLKLEVVKTNSENFFYVSFNENH